MADRTRSKTCWDEANRYLVGGVNSPVRAFSAVGSEPFFVMRAHGSRVYDIDGNSYIDYVCSWGPLILGHAPPAVVNAVAQAVAKGTSYGMPTPGETELARTIVEYVPSIEKVRLVNSGTEATMSAVRVARGFTGRNKIVKFAGCYHGHVDPLLVKAGSGATTLGVPSSPGVPDGCTRDTIVLPYNDVEAVRAAFTQDGREIAAAIVEPVAGNMGVVPPRSGFLEELRTQTSAYDSVLIFDEVMTGFRVSRGGAQELYGITPDITTLGKIIGGGLPVGAYGGKREIMDAVAPIGPVYQAGTLSGNPLAVAAGKATLEALSSAKVYEKLEARSFLLEEGLRRAASKSRTEVSFSRVGSMMTVFFTSEDVFDYESALRCDTKRFAKFFRAMLDGGISIAPSQFEAAFVSTAHSRRDIDATIRAAEKAFQAA